jgi:hypothetical protein
MFTIAITVDAPLEAAAPIEHFLSERCETIVGSGRCPKARELDPEQVIAWHVVVRTEDTLWTRLALDFYDRNSDGALLESRHLAFTESDAQSGRWASTAAVIAAFVSARDSTAQPADDEPEPASLETEGGPFSLDVGGTFGSTIDAGLSRFGALGRLSVELPAPSLIAVVTAQYAERRAARIDHTWWSAAAGIGSRLDFVEHTFGLEFMGCFVYQRLGLGTRDPATGAEDDDARSRFGGRLTTNLYGQILPKLGLVAGGDVELLSPEVAVFRGGLKQQRESSLGYSLGLALRFGL